MYFYKDNLKSWLLADVDNFFLKATQEGHKEVVNLLLKNKADVNLKDNFGCTALYIATKVGDRELVEVLLKNNADANIQSDTGNSPLIAGKMRFRNFYN